MGTTTGPEHVHNIPRPLYMFSDCPRCHNGLQSCLALPCPARTSHLYKMLLGGSAEGAFEYRAGLPLESDFSTTVSFKNLGLSYV